MRPRLPRLPKIGGNGLERGSASARISAEARIVPSGKRSGVGTADNAAESRLKLQLVHLTLESFNLVLLNGVEHLLDGSSRVRIDGCLRLEVRLSESSLLAELTDVALQLVAEVTDTVAEPHSLLDVLVRQTTNSILKAIEVHGIAQTCLRDRLAIRATSIPACTEHEREQHGNPPGAVTASAIAVIVATSDSGDVRQAHVFHFALLSQNLAMSILCAE